MMSTLKEKTPREPLGLGIGKEAPSGGCFGKGDVKEYQTQKIGGVVSNRHYG
jgi:hypothetical protein